MRVSGILLYINAFEIWPEKRIGPLVGVILFSSTKTYFTISVHLKYGLMRGIAFGRSGLIKGRRLHIKLYLISTLLFSYLQRVDLWLVYCV